MRNSPIAAIQSEHGRITYDGKAIKVFECTQAGEKVSELVEVDSLGSVSNSKKMIWDQVSSRIGPITDT